MRGELRHIAGVPATTAADSIFAACRALGLRRVTAISPYTEAVDAAEHRFFAEGGIETIAGAHLGITEGFRLAAPGPDAILDLALRAWDQQSDGLIAACLNFRSHQIIEALGARIGKPVGHLDPGSALASAAARRRRYADPRLRPAVARALTKS